MGLTVRPPELLLDRGTPNRPLRLCKLERFALRPFFAPQWLLTRLHDLGMICILICTCGSFSTQQEERDDAVKLYACVGRRGGGLAIGAETVEGVRDYGGVGIDLCTRMLALECLTGYGTRGCLLADTV